MIEAAITYAMGSALVLALALSLLASHGRDIAIDAVEIAIEADPTICAQCSRANARLPFGLAVFLGAASVFVLFANVTRGRRTEPMAIALARFIVRSETPGMKVQHAPGAVRHGDDDEAAER